MSNKIIGINVPLSFEVFVFSHLLKEKVTYIYYGMNFVIMYARIKPPATCTVCTAGFKMNAVHLRVVQFFL